MCGIAGILNWHKSPAELRSVLEGMAQTQRHRGPDDRGIFISQPSTLNSQPLCGLAHTRLSILDLSAAGHQPMSTADGRFTITFNGEIYNFQELRKELEAEGERFRSHTDTEVLLAMYRRYGPACLRELAGMFAFAIWDERERSCFLARDPLGIKPLHFAQTESGSLVFASEIRSVLASGLMSRRVSASAFHKFLLFGSVPEPDTLVEGIERLPAGYSMLWREGRGQPRRYWEISFASMPTSQSEAVAAVRSALEESVSRHFVSDVPVGIFLSGGIDSTTLLALAARQNRTDLRTFCISFDDPEYDEGRAAARTAAHFGARHTDWRLDAATGKELLRQFLAVSDHPSLDGFNTFCVSKHAHDCGMKVVLSGLGGDELFAGYPSFNLVSRLVRWRRWAGLGGVVRRAAGRTLEQMGRAPRIRRLGSFLADLPSTAAAYWCARGIFTPREALAITEHYLGQRPIEAHGATHFFVPPQPTLLDEVSWLELSRYMRYQLLRDSDVMSMAWGLELRVPFVDACLVETISRIPAALRLAPGKQLLRDAVPELPEWVLRQPKRGFRFPFEKWMAEEWRDVLERLETRSPVRLQSWYRRWCLMVLEDYMQKLDLKVEGGAGSDSSATGGKREELCEDALV